MPELPSGTVTMLFTFEAAESVGFPTPYRESLLRRDKLREPDLPVPGPLAHARGAEPDRSVDARNPEPEVLDLVASLVDKSLLRQLDGPGGEPRFTMLETIREYALEQLEASGEADQIRRRHAEWCVALAETAEPELPRATDAGWFDLLEAELGNIRAALSWSDESDEVRQLLPRLTGALWNFWWQLGHWNEGRYWYERALEIDVGPETSPA